MKLTLNSNSTLKFKTASFFIAIKHLKCNSLMCIVGHASHLHGEIRKWKNLACDYVH